MNDCERKVQLCKGNECKKKVLFQSVKIMQNLFDKELWKCARHYNPIAFWEEVKKFGPRKPFSVSNKMMLSSNLHVVTNRWKNDFEHLLKSCYK